MVRSGDRSIRCLQSMVHDCTEIDLSALLRLNDNPVMHEFHWKTGKLHEIKAPWPVASMALRHSRKHRF